MAETFTCKGRANWQDFGIKKKPDATDHLLNKKGKQ